MHTTHCLQAGFSRVPWRSIIHKQTDTKEEGFEGDAKALLRRPRFPPTHPITSRSDIASDLQPYPMQTKRRGSKGMLKHCFADLGSLVPYPMPSPNQHPLVQNQQELYRLIHTHVALVDHLPTAQREIVVCLRHNPHTLAHGQCVLDHFLILQHQRRSQIRVGVRD